MFPLFPAFFDRRTLSHDRTHEDPQRSGESFKLLYLQYYEYNIFMVTMYSTLSSKSPQW